MDQEFEDIFPKIEIDATVENDAKQSGVEALDADMDRIMKMEKEEEIRLEEMNKKELAAMRRKLEVEQHEKEVKDASFKRLMHLLEKSKFYANFLVQKVETSIQEMKKTKKKRKLEMENIDGVNKVLKKQKLDGSNLSEEHGPVKVEEEDGNENEEPCTTLSELGVKVNVNQPKLLEGTALRDYQMDGLTWLRLLFETGMNGILADEMGLGKTVQVIALICHLYEKRVIGPFLIVAPLSTLPNWLLEFSRFSPQLPVIVYHGRQEDRIPLRTKITSKTNVMGVECFPVVLTSYELPVRDSYLSKIKWKYVIVDEGHKLKNYKSQLARTLKSFVTVNRLLLTGTPLQNNLTELWSLLHFLLPEIFNTLDTFQTWLQVEQLEESTESDQLINKHDKIISVLHEILTPFLLRREKKNVNLQLPKKKEVLVYCPLTRVQHKLYSTFVDKSILNSLTKTDTNLVIPDNPDGSKQKRYSKLRNNETERRRFLEEENSNLKDIIVVNDGQDEYSLHITMNAVHIMLKKIVNHPYLIQTPVLPGSNIMRIDERLVSSSGKLTILDGLLKRLKERGHKVLVFSTMTQLLNLVEEVLIMRGYIYERLDGNNSIEERKQSIRRFNVDEDVFVFLLSTRAGGLGINLTAADTVVIFDSDWNPQADLQAQDRCHRIGQTKPVIVYRFVSVGTIDEKIVSRADAKRKLEKIIIQGGKFNSLGGRKEFTQLEDLKQLLNEKQHRMKIYSNGSALTDEQWQELLDRSDLLTPITVDGKS